MLILLSVIVVLTIKFTLFYDTQREQERVGAKSPFWSFSDETIPIAILDRNSIGGALYSYFKKFNKYPQGSNAEIMRVLDQEYLLSHYITEGLNKNHEYLDVWGTPYEIRISPDGEFQLRSAGPNKIFGDDDDKVLEDQLQ